jgi:hypothetical protein
MNTGHPIGVLFLCHFLGGKMRQIYIDLTTDRAPSSAGSFIGYIGEHNATELLISIPQTMVNKSDYQVLVFQSGPMVFRSGRITEDSTKNTYRDGNTIHSLISKSLTRVTALSIQVECYKEDFDGQTTLVGKTQTVPNLMLKPSPDGFPAFNYDGSYEDIDKAIDNAHKHDNLELLHKFGVDEEGALTFDGYRVGNSAVQTYATPSEFPETANVGTMAFAENDDEEIPIETTSIECAKKYERIRLKFKPDITSFSVAKSFVERSDSDIKIGAVSAEYLIAHDDEIAVAQYAFMHIDGMLSMAIATPTAYELTKMAYGKDPFVRNADGMLYLYNTIPGFTSDGTFTPLDIGWYRVITSDSNFVADSYFNISCDSSVIIEKLTEDDPFFAVYHDVGIIPLEEITNSDLHNEFLSKIFELVPPPVKRKGLYIFTSTGWTSLEDYINSSPKIVNTFADLPDDCPVGTLAHVLYDGGQVEPCNKSTFNKDSIYAGVYFAPFPVHATFLFDYSIHGQYMEGTQNFKGCFDVETMLEYDLISVSVSRNYDTSYSDMYVYSLKDQTLSLDGLTGHLYEGWNKIVILPDESVYVKQITNSAEVPFVVSNPDAIASPWGYKITDIQINGDDVDILHTHFLSPNQYVYNDNGAGLWIKNEDGWVKTENPEEFLMKEIER